MSAGLVSLEASLLGLQMTASLLCVHRAFPLCVSLSFYKDSSHTELDPHFKGFDFFFFKVTPAAHGSSQARGQIRAAAAGLCHGHSNTRSEPPL